MWTIRFPPLSHGSGRDSSPQGEPLSLPLQGRWPNGPEGWSARNLSISYLLDLMGMCSSKAVGAGLTLPLPIDDCAVSFYIAYPRVCTNIHPLCQWNAAGRSDPPLRRRDDGYLVYSNRSGIETSRPDISGPYNRKCWISAISNRFVDDAASTPQSRLRP